jgi:hypothetical protein
MGWSCLTSNGGALNREKVVVGCLFLRIGGDGCGCGCGCGTRGLAAAHLGNKSPEQCSSYARYMQPSLLHAFPVRVFFALLA